MTLLGQFPGNPRDALGYLAAAAPASPDTFFRSNLPRVGLVDSAGDSHVALATGVMTAVPIYLTAGDLVTSLSFLSGATAAGTPTNYWVALYDTATVPALIAQSADQLTAAWAANTVKTLALPAPYQVTKTGIYWAVCMVTATTPPSLVGSIGARPIVSGERNLSVSSGAGLTGTAPATLASPAVKNFVPLVVVT
ncbi:MAG: hypothetical protein L0Y54_19765 [Sporichthyaceae bacterium]|nr:hypothetical protein [Sporichthyaceae bacterium]